MRRAGEMIELSIIILSYGKVNRLRACLEALCEQTQPTTDFEVLVVACCEPGPYRHMFADLVTPYTLRVICQVGSNPGAARNRAAEASVGRYCLFLDENIVADRRLVSEHLKVQGQQAGSVGIGRIDLKLPSRTNTFAHYLAQQRRDYYIELRRGTQPPSFVDCSSANLSVPRAAFARLVALQSIYRKGRVPNWAIASSVKDYASSTFLMQLETMITARAALTWRKISRDQGSPALDYTCGTRRCCRTFNSGHSTTWLVARSCYGAYYWFECSDLVACHPEPSAHQTLMDRRMVPFPGQLLLLARRPASCD